MPSPRRTDVAAKHSPPLLLPTDVSSFLSLMADALRLPPEALSTALVYIHRYNRWLSESPSELPPDGLLDDYVILSLLPPVPADNGIRHYASPRSP